MNTNTMYGSPVLRECHQQNFLTIPYQPDTPCQQNFLTIPPRPCQPDTPWVCGEGEIVSIYYLDGSVQFYFVPKTCHTPCNQLMGCNQTAIPNNSAAWLISGISQRVQNLNWQQPQAPVFTQQNVVPPYQLKFHRDSCTSTTDLHYFIPKQNAICFQRAEMAVQATNKISLLTPNNKVIDINITAEERSKKKAQRSSSSCAGTETSQKPKCDCSSSRPCSSKMSRMSENKLSSSDGTETSCDEGCSGNKSKTSKIQKPKAESKTREKKLKNNKSVRFVKRTDCSDTDMHECDEGGSQQIGNSEYYSFSRKRY